MQAKFLASANVVHMTYARIRSVLFMNESLIH